MAFTPEQQLQIDLQVAPQMVVENVRQTNLLEIENRRAKLDMVRLARDTLIENSRSKPVDSRDVSAEDIKNYAQSLMNYINE